MSDMLQHIRAEAEKGFTCHTGIEITETLPGKARGKIEIRDHHRNPGGNIHGGVIFCLADVVGGCAAVTVGYLPVTVSSNINYMRSMRETRVIFAEAEVIKAGRTTAFVEISVRDEKNEETARVLATYQNVKGRVKK